MYVRKWRHQTRAEAWGKMLYPNFSTSSLTQLGYSWQVNTWKDNQVEYLIINHVSSSRFIMAWSNVRHIGLITSSESDKLSSLSSYEIFNSWGPRCNAYWRIPRDSGILYTLINDQAALYLCHLLPEIAGTCLLCYQIISQCKRE